MICLSSLPSLPPFFSSSIPSYPFFLSPHSSFSNNILPLHPASFTSLHFLPLFPPIPLLSLFSFLPKLLLPPLRSLPILSLFFSPSSSPHFSLSLTPSSSISPFISHSLTHSSSLSPQLLPLFSSHSPVKTKHRKFDLSITIEECNPLRMLSLPAHPAVPSAEDLLLAKK